MQLPINTSMATRSCAWERQVPRKNPRSIGHCESRDSTRSKYDWPRVIYERTLGELIGPI